MANCISLLEEAIIDGAGMGTTFWKIVLPMAKNTTMTVLTYNFVGQYGRVNWGSTFAAIVITIVPTLVIYFFFNKNITEGMAAGAVES